MRKPHPYLLLILILLYGVYLVAFKGKIGARLYRINDQMSFMLKSQEEGLGEAIGVTGYRKTSAFVSFLCGSCDTDLFTVNMPLARYIKGDYVYSETPQYQTAKGMAKTDIVNLRTGETITVDVPANLSGTVDLSTLPAYKERELVADPQYKLTRDYVMKNFAPLSTYSETCLPIHLGFGIALAFLIFPPLFFGILEAIFSGDNNR